MRYYSSTIFFLHLLTLYIKSNSWNMYIQWLFSTHLLFEPNIKGSQIVSTMVVKNNITFLNAMSDLFIMSNSCDITFYV